jgi:hypothetical protein
LRSSGGRKEEDHTELAASGVEREEEAREGAMAGSWMLRGG